MKVYSAQAGVGGGWPLCYVPAVPLSRPAARLNLQLADSPWIILTLDILSTLTDIQLLC
jgi:hypothetical protein